MLMYLWATSNWQQFSPFTICLFFFYIKTWKVLWPFQTWQHLLVCSAAAWRVRPVVVCSTGSRSGSRRRTEPDRTPRGGSSPAERRSGSSASRLQRQKQNLASSLFDMRCLSFNHAHVCAIVSLTLNYSKTMKCWNKSVYICLWLWRRHWGTYMVCRPGCLIPGGLHML